MMILFSEATRKGSFSFPEQASTFAESVDGMYAFIFWVSLFFFVVINVIMVYFVVKYRRKSPADRLPEKSPSHHMMLELAWTILPCFLLVGMFVQGALGYLNSRTPPETADAVERIIDVKAKKWGWVFVYPNGDQTTELHLAKGVPVKFRMSSEDALHAFFIREFRIKQDCVPGRYTECWVKPTMTRTPDQCIKVGEDGTIERGEFEPFHLQCAEYCGDQHSQMRTEWDDNEKTWKYPVYVHDCSFEELTKFTTWKEKEHSNWENGKFYFQLYGCVGCHAIGGEKQKTGPNFQKSNYDGKVARLNPGGSGVFDDNYIRESINYSTKYIVPGFKNQMPKFEIPEDRLMYLVEFIKSPEAAPASSEAEPKDDSNPDESKKVDEKSEKKDESK